MKWLDILFIAAVIAVACWALGYVLGCIFDVAKSTCTLCGGSGKRKVDGMVGAHQVKCPVCSGTGKRP